MAGLTSQQRVIRDRIVSIGRSRRLVNPTKEIKANLETGIVESNLSNPEGGDADSAGYRQERRSLYKNPTNLDAAINRFYDEADKVANQYGSSGALAAAVQRPAAQYRGRYAQVSKLAQQLLGAGAGSSSPGRSSTLTTVDQAGFDQAKKRSVLANFLSTQKGAGENPLLTTGLLVPGRTPQKSDFTTKRTVTTSLGSAGSATSPTVVGTLQQIVEREAGISAHAKPYKWGGGHQAAGGSLAQSFDCSGAVSRALGINPRVASQFQSYGDAGPGKHVAIYAKSDHVIMATKMNGAWHFFGTSASNPGGGAGWIPLSALSKSYLAQFTVRHPPGL